VIATLWLLACGGPKLPVHTLDVGGHPVRAELAYTNASREHGLMERDALAEDSGMLFIYGDEEIRGFWMKNTRIPLSIAFADRRGEIVRITDMEPHDTTRVSSLVPAMYALEMEKGWFEAHGVKKGDTIGDLPTGLVIE
jgi:uncharacterized membrane protein (UPF0127 family)